MKSESCRKTRGAGVPSDVTSTPGPPALAPADSQHIPAESEASLCRHTDASGRRCNMLVMNATAELCTYHARRRLHTQLGSEAATAELLASAENLNDAESVFRFLGTLVRQVTLKRISRRDAVTLAYICQLLLNSLGAGYREAMFHLQEERVEALAAAKQPPKIIWDLPGPPYEPPDPLEAALASKQNKDAFRRD